MKNARLYVLSIVSLCLFGCKSFQESNSEKYELLPSSYNFDKPLESLDYYGLRGNVKEVSCTTYDAIEKYGEIIKGEIDYPIAIQYFSKKGQLIETKNLDASRVERIRRYEYNPKTDNLTNETQSTWYNSEGMYVTSFVRKYSYDKHNRLNAITSYQGNGDLSRTESLQYDSRGNLIKSDARNYLNDSVFDHYVTYYNYNSNNYIIEEIEDDPDGYYEMYSYKYDNRNRVSEVIGRNRNGWLTEYRVYKYDGKNETEEIYYSADLFSKIIDLHYQSSEIEDLKTLQSDDLWKTRYNVHLYSKGIVNPIVPNKVLQNVYQYDKKRNWVLHINFDENGSPNVYQERHIIYY